MYSGLGGATKELQILGILLFALSSVSRSEDAETWSSSNIFTSAQAMGNE